MSKLVSTPGTTTCGCSGSACGVMHNYDEMYRSWATKYSMDHADGRRIHARWKSLGKLAANGRI